MSDNWVVENLNNSLQSWNGKFSEIITLITQAPTEFRNGAIWNIMQNVYGALQAIGLALLVLFFVGGVMKTCSNLTEVKRPEQALKLFIRFALAKGVIVYGMELMLAVFKIIQGIITTIVNSSGFTNATPMSLPQEIVTAINNCTFFESIPLWAVSLIAGLVITVLAFVIILTVYGRFFKLYLYTAVSPILLATFGGEPTQSIGRNFVKSFIAVCFEGVIIALSCVIFSVFATTAPTVDVNASAVAMVWKYVGEVIFNMLVLVGTIKIADRVSHEITGL